MAQVSHHHTSQLGAAAVAPPGRQESFPPPIPALHHLNDEDTAQAQASEQETGQLGKAAVAPPADITDLPPVPALHHLGDEHTIESQIGPTAIASPIGEISHPPPIPAQYHLDEEDDKNNQSPVKPFSILAQAQRASPSSSRPATPSNQHTSQSQLGPAAIAGPSGIATLPPPAPDLHHIKDEHTHETQLGKPAIAPTAEFVSNQQKENEELAFSNLPPFPDDVPTAPLLRISLQKLLDQDASEIDKVWKASRELGFFYLDLRNAVSTTTPPINGPSLLKDVDALFSLGEEVFALPLDEKQKYDFIEQGSYYGYKGLGAGVIDAQGTRDRNEFYNISKDDMLGISEPLPAPELLQKQSSRDLLAGYMQKSHTIVTLLLGILNSKLGLPENKLQSLHKLQAVSGDQVRWVNSPPQPQDDRKKALGEHTGILSPTPFSSNSHLNLLPNPNRRFRHANPPRQPPRRPANPATLNLFVALPTLVLRPPPAQPPNRQPRRLAREIQRRDPAQQYPPRSEPTRFTSG